MKVHSEQYAFRNSRERSVSVLTNMDLYYCVSTSIDRKTNLNVDKYDIVNLTIRKPYLDLNLRAKWLFCMFTHRPFTVTPCTSVLRRTCYYIVLMVITTSHYQP